MLEELMPSAADILREQEEPFQGESKDKAWMGDTWARAGKGKGSQGLELYVPSLARRGQESSGTTATLQLGGFLSQYQRGENPQEEGGIGN